MKWYWLTPTWWKYVLDDSRADKEGPYDTFFYPDQILWKTDYYLPHYFNMMRNRFLRCRCRAQGHPAGVVWYSWGLEPNMHCKCCGEDLG